MSAHVRDEVAEPLAAKALAARRGGQARGVTVKVRAGLEPSLVVGGAARLVSGKAQGRQLFYGVEWGGGGRRTFYRTAHGPVRRHTTRQFPRPPVRAFLLETFAREADDVSEAWLSVLDPFLDEWEG